MLLIDQQLLRAVTEAAKLEDLFPMLQQAIELEHSTIPPYLTALFSFKPDKGQSIRSIIHSIVIEEMMHMTIACNLLNALGGEPILSKPDFVPSYPNHLPMCIGESLIVGLERYSLKLVEEVFMKIEEPNDPLHFPTRIFAAAEPEYKTIGDFYMALQAKIIEIAPDILPGEESRQVTSEFFPVDLLYPIRTKGDAINSINTIVEQGEGTPMSPIGVDNKLAHYYKFEELFQGKELVVDPCSPNGYAFSGPEIPFEPADVQPLYPNTKASMFQHGTEERKLIDLFNQQYSNMLYGLHQTFNGRPEDLSNNIGLMIDLRLACQKMAQMPFPGKSGYTIGPSYEFMPPTQLI
jgi:rubrerythrin